MEKKQFAHIRKKMGKTQKQLAQLLGLSIKAIHSYEQGWRRIPVHAERQIYFLLFSKNGIIKGAKSCWVQNKCPVEKKKQCPAWEYKAGKYCWFISGTICSGVVHENWKEKMKVCHKCEVFTSQLDAVKNDEL